jgi:hypothetical protein
MSEVTQPVAGQDGQVPLQPAPEVAKDQSLVTPNTPAPQAGEKEKPPGDGPKPLEPETKEDPAAPKVPEKYELKLPENSPLQASALEEIAAFAKEQGFSNEQAQKLVERQSEAIARFVEGQKEQLHTADADWKKTLSADPEIGGIALEENGKVAFRAAAKFFGEEFVDAMIDMKLNHYPPLFKGLVRIGKAMANDSFVPPGSAAGAKKSAEEVLYGSSGQ